MNLTKDIYERICRTCLSLLEGTNKRSIFSNNVQNLILNLTSLQMFEEDGLPSYICNYCFELLNNAYSFKTKIEDSDKKLKQHLISQNANSFFKGGLANEDSQKMQEEVSSDESNLNVFRYSKNPETEKTVKQNPNESSNKNKKIIEKVSAPTKVHRNIPNHNCSECGKKYRTTYDLTVHLRSHTGLRPYSCHCCEKTFADPRSYKKHKKIHTGTKPFKCEICDKSFIHLHTLKTI